MSFWGNVLCAFGRHLPGGLHKASRLRMVFRSTCQRCGEPILQEDWGPWRVCRCTSSFAVAEDCPTHGLG